MVKSKKMLILKKLHLDLKNVLYFIHKKLFIYLSFLKLTKKYENEILSIIKSFLVFIMPKVYSKMEKIGPKAIKIFCSK